MMDKKSKSQLQTSLERQNKIQNKMRVEEQKRKRNENKKTKEKELKIYMTLNHYKKNRAKEIENRKSNELNKIIEKNSKLEEMEKQEKLKARELILKLDTVEKKTNQMISLKNDTIKKFNEKRKQYINSCKQNRKRMLKSLSDERFFIMDYQSYFNSKGMEKIKKAKNLKEQSTERTLKNQINFIKNIRPFLKKLELIKSASILKLSTEKRKKIYKQKKRIEEEKRKREEEEEENKRILNLKA